MISTHILDTSLGTPAQGIPVKLEKLDGTQWQELFEIESNSDGRIQFQCASQTGTFRLQFQVEGYFKQTKRSGFFSTIPVIFNITDATRKYHVPLLLNPYGYSTYRGS